MQVFFPTSVNCAYQMSENILPQLADHVHFSLYISWQEEILLPQKLAYKITGSILIEEERKINFHIKL